MQLAPCGSCGRHVRAAEMCPFCGSGRAIEAPLHTSPAGRLSRAMVFASATLVPVAPIVAACGGKAKPAETQIMPEEHDVNEGHKCVDPDPKRIEELEKNQADAKTDEEKKQIEQELQIARQPSCMPYGAPPRRRRVV